MLLELEKEKGNCCKIKRNLDGIILYFSLTAYQLKCHKGWYGAPQDPPSYSPGLPGPPSYAPALIEGSNR